MIKPRNVEYGKTKVLRIIYEEKDFSIALLSFNDSVVYGIRWNGSESDKSKGTPTAFGKPTWFIIPNKLVESFVKINIKGED